MRSQLKRMKVAVIGTGALGTLFGSHLIKTGNNVIFVDGWKTLLDAKKKDPFCRLHHPDGTIEEIPVNVFSPSNIPSSPIDLVTITVKSTQTESAMKFASKLIDFNTIILTLQGGLNNPDIISKYIPSSKHLLCGATTCSAGSVPGKLMEIEKFGVSSTKVWPFGLASNGKPCSHVEDVVNFLNKTKFNIELTSKAISERWVNLLYYTSSIAVSSFIGRDFGTVFNHSKMNHVIIELAKECAKIAKLEGVDKEQFNEKIAIQAVKELVQVCPHHYGSMFKDIQHKRVTEIDSTAGALLRLAEKHYVDIPYTKAIYSIIDCIQQTYQHPTSKLHKLRKIKEMTEIT